MFTRLSLFQKYYKLIAMNLSKQQKLDVDPKAIQQISFTGNLSRAESATNVFHYRRNERSSFKFFKRNS